MPIIFSNENIVFLESAVFSLMVLLTFFSPELKSLTVTCLEDLMALVNVKRIVLIVMEEEGEDYQFLDVVRILYNKILKNHCLTSLF